MQALVEPETWALQRMRMCVRLIGAKTCWIQERAQPATPAVPWQLICARQALTEQATGHMTGQGPRCSLISAAYTAKA